MIIPNFLSNCKALEKTDNETKQDLEGESSGKVINRKKSIRKKRFVHGNQCRPQKIVIYIKIKAPK